MKDKGVTRLKFWAELALIGLFIILSSMSSLANATDSVTTTLHAGNYNITKDNSGYDVISMEGFSDRISRGEPMLVEKNFDVLLPPNADGSSLQLRIISSDAKVLDGTYDIKPSPQMVPQKKTISTDTYTNPVIAVPPLNKSVWQADTNYPAMAVELLPYSQMRKWFFVKVNFMPFQYNPVTKKLTLNEKVTVEISYNLKAAPSAEETALLADTSFDDLAKDMFVNYDDAKSFYPTMARSIEPGGATYDYVIITTNAIKSGSTKLNAFIAHKQSLGFSVLVVTETDFNGLTGQAPNHRAEKIRQWLKNNYISKGVKYVLLIGNPSPYESGEGDIPMKMCWPNTISSSDQESPTDYFYADLTGDWDISGNQIYGELVDYNTAGGVDFAPEVIVGRIPVYASDYTTLDSILQKIITYETSADTAWRKSALLPMSFSDAGTDGAYLGDQMKYNYLNGKGYSSWRMYQHGISGACTLDSVKTSEEGLRGIPNTPNVLNRWVANDFGIVAWWGHGNSQGAYVGYGSCGDGPIMESSNTGGLDNSHPAHTYQCSCTNGYPEDSANLQYSILKNGGITTTSATRVSWYYPGQTDFVNSNSNAGFGYEYVKRLVQETAAGSALYDMKAFGVPAPSTIANLYDRSAILMNFYDFNLYGDPSVSIMPTNKWRYIGGYATSNPVAISDDQGRRHVFVKGSDNRLYDNVDGIYYTIGGYCTSDAAVAKDGTGKLHIFVRGGDYAIYNKVFDTSAWSITDWVSLGGYATSNPSCALQNSAKIYMRVAVLGPGNALYLNDFTASTRTPSTWYNMGGYCAGDPCLIFDKHYVEHRFVIGGADHQLWDLKGVMYTSEGEAKPGYEHQWIPLGGYLDSSPKASLEPGWDSYTAVTTTNGGRLWINSVYAADTGFGESGSWYSLGGAGITSNTNNVFADSDKCIHTFVRTNDGAVWENVFNSYYWAPSSFMWWLQGGFTNFRPTALVDANTCLYALGGDHALYQKIYGTKTAGTSGSEVSEKQKGPEQNESAAIPPMMVEGGDGRTLH